MESQDKEKEFRQTTWEAYRKEWETASKEKRIELHNRMRRWKALMKNGLPASQAYYKAMEEELVPGLAEEPVDKHLPTLPISKMNKAPLVFLGIALVASIIYCAVITDDRNALNTELESVQAELSSAKQTLTSTQAELGLTKDALTSTKQSLASTESELSSTNQTLVSTQSELSSTKQSLVSTQSELKTTTATLKSIQNDLEIVEASLQLYQDTLGVEVFLGMQDKITKGGSLLPREYVNLIDNPEAKNPTWSQLIDFLYTDSTDEEYYNLLSFNCTNFAEEVHNNAEAAGIRAAFVAVIFDDEEEGHALNAFKTTDKGLVYVDCTGGDWYEHFLQELYNYTIEYDKVAYVYKGKEYRLWSIDEYTFYDYRYDKPYRSTSDWEGDNIVESIRIYW